MQIDAEDYNAILRRDFYCFVERSFAELNPGTEFAANWHIEVIADALERCRRGEIRRLIINLPPRSLKSHCASIAFPCWVLGHNPSAQIICASYAQDLADKHAIDSRALMNSFFYREIFPTRLSSEKRAVSDFLTNGRGCRKATSVGGVLTGRGADFIVIDDPLQPDKALSDTRRKTVNDWYDNTLCSRLNHKLTGCIIVVMQRLHEDDLVGHLLQVERRQRIDIEPKWHVIRLPAIAEEDEAYTVERWFGCSTYRRKTAEVLHPEREPLEILEQLRETQGEYNFAGQYQQNPAPMGGGLVKSEWFNTYTELERPKQFELIFQSWDGEQSQGTERLQRLYHLGHQGKETLPASCFSRAFGISRLETRSVRASGRLGAKNILIEDKASGTQLIQELIYERVHGITKYQSKQEKIMRMRSVTSTMQSSLVYQPERAPWLAAYTHELVTFPKAKHDDQADSTSQALDWAGIGLRAHAGIFEYYRELAMKTRGY